MTMNEKSNFVTTPITSRDIPQLESIALLYFAYRDFVGDADRILERYGFGRAHHRVLFFVNRKPGMTVADLLDILKITKQSLARVLRQLIDSGYIIQTAGATDRRKRHLFPTNNGRELILALSAPQSERIKSAYSEIDTANKEQVLQFLAAMIDGSGTNLPVVKDDPGSNST